MAAPNEPENDLAESTAPEIDTAGKPQHIYCLACRCHTENKNLRTENFSRERKIQKAVCAKCGKRKNKFISFSQLNADN